MSRGDVIAYAGRPALVADRFAAHMLWTDDSPSLSSRAYWLKIGTRTVNACVISIKDKVDVNNPVTVACGTPDFALQRAANVHWPHLDLAKHVGDVRKGQCPRCLWFTGLYNWRSA